MLNENNLRSSKSHHKKYQKQKNHKVDSDSDTDCDNDIYSHIDLRLTIL